MNIFAAKQQSKEGFNRKGFSKRHKPISQGERITGFPAINGAIQRRLNCPCGGGCPRCVEKNPVQDKLTIGAPNDKYEQEADRVAEQVMRMPEKTVVSSQFSGIRREDGHIQRMCSECEKEEQEEPIQTKPIAEQITPLIQRQETEEPDEEEDGESIQAKPLTEQITPLVQRQEGPEEELEEKVEEPEIMTKSCVSSQTDSSNLQSQLNASKSAGLPLSEDTRTSMESAFGSDFSSVRVHTNSNAAQMNQVLHAQAFTNGSAVYFNKGKYNPDTNSGKHLLAHELTHVVQQSQNQARFIQRQLRVEEEATGLLQEAGEAVASESVRALIEICNQFPASVCPNSDCPSCFCSPLPLSRREILAFRDMVALYTLPGIAAKVSPRVVPLWETYIYGGSSVQDLSAEFGGDFAASRTTIDMNTTVERVLRTTINPRRRLPNVIDIPSRVPSLIRQMNREGHTNEMNFNVIGEIPGNIAGGVGARQTACSAGARPSPINDRRDIEGSAQIFRTSPRSVTVIPDMYYVVQDTIDLCPGNCGADIEQIATLPFSWLEASGVSGDVPFRVRYPSGLGPFTVSY